MVMSGPVKHIGTMTLRAHAVTFRPQFEAVGLVTIAAYHSLLVHFALQK